TAMQISGLVVQSRALWHRVIIVSYPERGGFKGHRVIVVEDPHRRDMLFSKRCSFRSGLLFWFAVVFVYAGKMDSSNVVFL
ncbi:hypothetical protein A2U01_0078942, partial [Trifolium medium]|nr:hypothetical protein [Trifolium medium]